MKSFEVLVSRSARLDMQEAYDYYQAQTGVWVKNI